MLELNDHPGKIRPSHGLTLAVPLAGNVVTTATGAPAVVVTVGEGGVVLRHLDGDVQRAPFRAWLPTCWTRPARFGASSPATPAT